MISSGIALGGTVIAAGVGGIVAPPILTDGVPAEAGGVPATRRSDDDTGDLSSFAMLLGALLFPPAQSAAPAQPVAPEPPVAPETALRQADAGESPPPPAPPLPSLAVAAQQLLRTTSPTRARERARLDTDRSRDALHPEFAQRLDRVLSRMKDAGFTVTVVETTRSPERQRALFAQGRTAPGPVVTWTLRSRHLEGRAADLRPAEASAAAYEALQRIAREEGLHTLGARDPGHVEWRGAQGADEAVPMPRAIPQAEPRAARSAEDGRMSVPGRSGQPLPAAAQGRRASVAKVAQVAQVASVAKVARVAHVADAASVVATETVRRGRAQGTGEGGRPKLPSSTQSVSAEGARAPREGQPAQRPGMPEALRTETFRSAHTPARTIAGGASGAQEGRAKPGIRDTVGSSDQPRHAAPGRAATWTAAVPVASMTRGTSTGTGGEEGTLPQPQERQDGAFEDEESTGDRIAPGVESHPRPAAGPAIPTHARAATTAHEAVARVLAAHDAREAGAAPTVGTLQLTFDPERDGLRTLDLTFDGARLDARIETNDVALARHLDRDAGQLVQRLERSGIESAQVQVRAEASPAPAGAPTGSPHSTADDHRPDASGQRSDQDRRAATEDRQREQQHGRRFAGGRSTT